MVILILNPTKMNTSKSVMDANQVRYILKKMKKHLRMNDTVDFDKTVEDLSAVNLFFKRLGMFHQADKVRIMLCEFRNKSNDTQCQLKCVEELLSSTKHLIEKRKTMDQRRCSAEMAFNRLQVCDDDVHPYDVIMAPTQGGWHHSIVISVDNNTVVCYPVTTANRFQLRKIGCKSIEITGCDVEYLNGQRITSSAVRLDRKKVKVKDHVYNHAAIEEAINMFSCKAIYDDKSYQSISL